MSNELFLMFMLLVKHYLADFPLQRHPFLYAHKGDIIHPGGWCHAGIHGGLTFLVLLFFDCGYQVSLIAGLVDIIIHYDIDFLKVQITNHFKWAQMSKHRNQLEIYNQNYFDAIGVDQLLHNLTYVAIVWVVS